VRWLIVILGILSGGCAQAASTAIDPAMVRAKAAECHLKPDQLKIMTSLDSKTEVHLGPGKSGELPDFQSLRCFIQWAGTQHGIRVGFISEPPPVKAR
jgi:hypothetical protein